MSIESSQSAKDPRILQEEIENAESTIRGVLGEIMVLGGNDRERSDIEEIIAKLKCNMITPAEAIRSACAVRDSKQSYH